MADITIRPYLRTEDGALHDMSEDFGLESFAGQVPAIGDLILNPGVIANLDRRDPQNREVWAVVGRMFNPRDLPDYIALIVEVRKPSDAEHALM